MVLVGNKFIPEVTSPKIAKPFLTVILKITVPFLYLLKPSENLWFADVFRGHRNGRLGQTGLKCLPNT